MQPSLIKLQKIFKLEAQMGFSNRAVIGGLESFAQTWAAEARLEALPEDLIGAITERLSTYGRLTANARQDSLRGLWRRIQRSSGEEPSNEFEDQRPAPASREVEPEPEKEQVLPVARPTGTVHPAPRQTAPVPAPAARTFSSPPRPDGDSAALDAPARLLNGVGPKNAQALEKLGINTLGDLLYYFPRDYVDYSQLKPINRLWYGERVTVIGSVENVVQRATINGRLKIIEAFLNDGSGVLRLTWFNQPWLVDKLRETPHITVSGKVEQYLGRLVMNSPEWEPVEQQNLSTNRIVPVYGLTQGVTQAWLRRKIHDVVEFWGPRVEDPLPAGLAQESGLIDLPTALVQTHYPENWEALQASRQRLAFDEILMLQLGVLEQKLRWQERQARRYPVETDWWDAQLSALPFALTNAQQRALEDIRSDLASGHPMNRLLQGDVGSGKTIVAGMAIAMILKHGAQAAIMAPTSILAEQHYRSLSRLLATADNGIAPEAIRLLIGSTPEAEKTLIRDGLADGSIRLVIGTHALLEDPVTFQDLQLVIIDEQHRFGVEQRAILRNKGDNPHLLVMTATPIPRSLALTLYGDLDLSVMDEMPPGRQPIETHLILPKERERAYQFIRAQVKQGRQAFIIYPLVEESEKSEAMAAVEQHQVLQKQIFPELSLGLLHGRLKPDEKDAVMLRFRDGLDHILVSTSVVEVGVDVPNATIMMVEGANRFGLAQLHQFRGRVGRGQHQSYCLLVPEKIDDAENERLMAMVQTNDGFVLADKDLQQRGPGDFLGTRQAGFSELRMASLSDVHLIEKARKVAQSIFAQDPALETPPYRLLSQAMQRFWHQTRSADIS